ncbi:hypothetical protein DFP73DRAFT_582849 [Morchella snyderi]|nr:hypothetical protein DFP73DRAFT_582849 [Morchella snyderi]
MNRKRRHPGKRAIRQNKKARQGNISFVDPSGPASSSAPTRRATFNAPALPSTPTGHTAPDVPDCLSDEQHTWLESNINLDGTSGLKLVLVMHRFRERFRIPITHAGVCNKYYSMLLINSILETPKHQRPIPCDNHHYLRLQYFVIFENHVTVPGDDEMEESYLRDGFPGPDEACFTKPPTRRVHPIHPRYTYITQILWETGYTWMQIMWLFGIQADEATFRIDDRVWNISAPEFLKRWAKLT